MVTHYQPSAKSFVFTQFSLYNSLRHIGRVTSLCLFILKEMTLFTYSSVLAQVGSWTSPAWPGDLATGIVTTHGAAHSQVCWCGEAWFGVMWCSPLTGLLAAESCVVKSGLLW